MYIKNDHKAIIALEWYKVQYIVQYDAGNKIKMARKPDKI